MHDTLVEVENLSFSYNGKEVLTDVSFTVEPGDYVGLVGPNGSGKSTLIRSILGLITPGRGKVLLFGKALSSFTDRQKIGYLPQKVGGLHQFFPATVKEVVSLGIMGRRKGDAEEAVEKAMGLMDVQGLRGRLVGELSGGEFQRVLLARALVNDPHLLILDEPTSAVDPETRERFFSILERLNRERRVAILLITHDVGTIGKFARKMLYLDRRLIFYGTFESFCLSREMTELFGAFSQHVICHMHD